MTTVTEQAERPTHVVVELAPRTAEVVRRAYFVALLAAMAIPALGFQRHLPYAGFVWGYALQVIAISAMRIFDRPKTAAMTGEFRTYLAYGEAVANVITGVAVLAGLATLTPDGQRLAPPDASWTFGCLVALGVLVTLMRTAERLQESTATAK